MPRGDGGSSSARGTISEKPHPHVFAAVEVLGLTLIDGGDTVAARLRTADGGEAAILMPVRAGEELARRIGEALNASEGCRSTLNQ